MIFYLRGLGQSRPSPINQSISRGLTLINSLEPDIYSAIDPSYLFKEVDVAMIIDEPLYTRKIVETTPNGRYSQNQMVIRPDYNSAGWLKW